MKTRSLALAGAIALATFTALPQTGRAQSGEAIVNGFVNQILRQTLNGNAYEYRYGEPRYTYRYGDPRYAYRYNDPRHVYRYDDRSRYDDRHRHRSDRRDARHRHHDRDHYARRDGDGTYYNTPRRSERDPGEYR